MFRLARLGLRLTPGAEGGSAEENQELFSELEEGKGSTLRNESRKQECIYFPCQKGVGAREGDHSQKNPHIYWETDNGKQVDLENDSIQPWGRVMPRKIGGVGWSAKGRHDKLIPFAAL